MESNAVHQQCRAGDIIPGIWHTSLGWMRLEEAIALGGDCSAVDPLPSSVSLICADFNGSDAIPCLSLSHAQRSESATARKACLLEEFDRRVGGEQGLMQQQLRQDAPEGPHVHLWAARLLPQDLPS